MIDYRNNSKIPKLEDLSEETVVWRYMDLAKFISLLQYKSLFFNRVDQFEDPYEGIINSPTKETLINQFHENSYLYDNKVDLGKKVIELYELQRSRIFVNCWHENENESAAMWKLYLKSNEGIAIKSTIGRLKIAINSSRIQVRRIKYQDYKSSLNILPIVNDLCFIKRNSFAHEKEIRLSFWDIDELIDGEEIIYTKESESSYKFMNIDCDIETLVESIYVAPDAPSWFTTLIKDISNHFGYEFDIIQSKLYTLS